MMERQLLLLGLLRQKAMHAYQLNEAIENNAGLSVRLKKATAYDLLRRMERDGWVVVRHERHGNRPPRRVYSLTPDGEAAFQRMLRASLASYQPAEFPGDISLAFIDAISPSEAVALLRKRRQAIVALQAALDGHDGESGDEGLAHEHQRLHLAAELAWLDSVIRRYG